MIIDLTAALENAMLLYPSPYLAPTEILPLATHSETKRSVMKISFSTHVSTHIDAPYHADPDGITVDKIPLDTLCGETVRITLTGKEKDAVIDEADLAPHEKLLESHKRIIIHTGWMEKTWGTMTYYEKSPYFSYDAVNYLRKFDLSLIGLDIPNIDRLQDTLPGVPAPKHGLILSKGIVLVENLYHLEKIPEHIFEFYAIPLKITGADGSPCRAFAIT